MGTDNLTTIRAAVRSALGGSPSEWSDALLDEAISAVVSDISRLSPREQLYVSVLNARVVSAESVTMSADDTWIALANKPLDRSYAIVVTNNAGTTTYDLNDDYLIDYAQGRIMALSSGDATGESPLKVTYKKSLIGIDISSLTDLIRIERVEVQQGKASPPQTFESFSRWGDLLWVMTKDSGSQTRFAENDVVYVWYMGEHSKPAAGSAGSYPAYLDDVVVKGAVAYALFSKHRERNLAAIGDIDLARAILDDIGENKSTLTTYLGDANTALDATKTALGTVDAEADALITAISTALNRIANILTIDTELMLDEGESLIDDITRGLNAATEYREYANTRLAIGQVFNTEAQLRIDKVEAIIQTALTYIQEGNSRLELADRYLTWDNLYITQANAYLASADRESAAADRLLLDARERHTDYWEHLRQRIENAQGRAKVSAIQLPT